MADLIILDPDCLVGGSGTRAVPFFSSLVLLALATAPAPGSRYRPSGLWAITKYSTVWDPLSRRGGTDQLHINPAIEDLDPHQKTILSDEIGVALSLGTLDAIFGVVGLADVYQLEKAGIIALAKGGGHRKMPDFLILLNKEMNGSKLVLLECKGSQTGGYYAKQLETACDKQLANVKTVAGLRSVPKIATAAEIAPGRPARMHIADPPDRLESNPDLERQLRANYLALEYSLFGDFLSANRVWEEAGLPRWNADWGPLAHRPEVARLIWEDQGILPLRGYSSGGKQRGARGDPLRDYGLMSVRVEASDWAKDHRNHPAKIENRPTFELIGDFQSEERQRPGGRSISSDERTALGVSVHAMITIPE